MSATTAMASSRRTGQTGFVIAWGFCLLFYFGQFVIRSAPGVIVPELTSAFGLTTLGVSSLLGLYYYTYSSFAIVAGAALDRFGAKYVIPTGIVVTAIGAIMFGLGSASGAEVGRLLQGAGAAFAFTGAVIPRQPRILRRLARDRSGVYPVLRDARRLRRAIRRRSDDPWLDHVATVLDFCRLRAVGHRGRSLGRDSVGT